MKKTKKDLFTKYFIVLIPLAFVLDLVLLHFFEKPIVQLLLCTFIINSLYQSFNATLYTFIFLILKQSIYYGTVVMPILLYAPFAIIFFQLRTLINLSVIAIPYIALIILLILKDGLFDQWALSNSFSYYTFIQICVNILVLYGILKLMIRGKLGNRL